MMLTGEIRSTGRKISHNAILSTTNLTRTDLVSNQGLRGVFLNKINVKALEGPARTAQ
jgi:hypothetical protein